MCTFSGAPVLRRRRPPSRPPSTRCAILRAATAGMLAGETMGEEALKLPKLDLPKPKRWDLAALGVCAAGVALVGANLMMVRGQPPGSSISSAATSLFVVAQIAVSLGALFVLGKTAKEGTIWGNLLAVAGLFLGMSGVLLAAALWAAA